MKVKEESEKAGLKLNIQKDRETWHAAVCGAQWVGQHLETEQPLW